MEAQKEQYDLKRKVMAIFFTTCSKSLKNWELLGMLDREIKLYQQLALQFRTLYLFTYGDAQERAYARLFPSNVVIVPKPRYLPTLVYSFLLPIVRRRMLMHVDILKTNQMDGSWTAVIAKKLYGGTLVVRSGYEWLQFLELAGRNTLKQLIARWTSWFAYRNADVVIHTSQGAAQFAVQRFGVPERKMIVIPNYIDTERFAPTGDEKQPGSVVVVGRIEPEKNLAALIEALEGLPATLTVIGNGSQQEILDELAKKKGVSVTWMGTVPQEDLPHALCSHDLYALPSLHEGSPKALLEAMSCGMPCIATDVPGSREIVQDSVNGIVSGTDAASLRKGILRLLEDPVLGQSVGEGARRTILDRYSLGKVLERELSVYTAL